MIRCIFFPHKWGEWFWVFESLTVGSMYQRECKRCGLVQHKGTGELDGPQAG